MSLFARFISSILFMALLWSPAAYAAKAVGTLMVVKGKVFIQKKGKGKKKKARVGTKIRAKDTIITEKNSRAKVVMMDKNIIHVSPKSQMNFAKYVFDPKKGKKEVLLNVLYGKVRSNVKQKYDGKKNKYQVKTKAAVAGVRGTDFLSSYNPSTSQAQFITFEGMVQVGKPGAGGQILNPVSVAPGMATTASTGSAGPSAPKAVPKTQLAAMDAESSGGPSPRTPANEGPGGPAEGGEEAGNDSAEPESGGEPEPKGEGGYGSEEGGPEPEGQQEGGRDPANSEGGPEGPPNGENGPAGEGGPAGEPAAGDGGGFAPEGEGNGGGPGGPGPAEGPNAGPGHEGGGDYGEAPGGPGGFADGGGDRGPDSVGGFEPGTEGGGFAGGGDGGMCMTCIDTPDGPGGGGGIVYDTPSFDPSFDPCPTCVGPPIAEPNLSPCDLNPTLCGPPPGGTTRLSITIQN